MLPFSLRRLTTPIAITGDSGAGKTVLYDALIGAINIESVPSQKSDDFESHRILLDTPNSRTRCGVIIVPGQTSSEQVRTLDRMFGASAYPAGIIHVVCFGHNKIWDSARVVGEELRAGTTNFNALTVQENRLAKELKEFEALCDRLRVAWERQSRVWLIIAVAKCDLYWPRLDEARRYYLPDDDTGSAFHTVLRRLVEHVGYSNFTGLAVLPVSCYPSDHEFDPTLTLQKPTLDFPKATALTNGFRSVLGEFCERQ